VLLYTVVGNISLSSESERERERERERCNATTKAVILLRKVRNSIMNYAVNLMEKNLGKNNYFSPILLFVSM
jgi:uncharacterized protein (DUF1015 family)